MTETSNTPQIEISSDIVSQEGSTYAIEVVVSTIGSLPNKTPNPLQRVCVFQGGSETCTIRVAYSEQQAKRERRREAINLRLMRYAE